MTGGLGLTGCCGGPKTVTGVLLGTSGTDSCVLGGKTVPQPGVRNAGLIPTGIDRVAGATTGSTLGTVRFGIALRGPPLPEGISGPGIPLGRYIQYWTRPRKLSETTLSHLSAGVSPGMAMIIVPVWPRVAGW